MKHLIILSLSLLVASWNYSQILIEVKVRVTDSDTKKGIANANVLIQETMMTAKTDNFGLAVFPSVPIRQVTIEVQKEGYLPKKEEINITTDKFNNTFAIELIKEKSNTVAIYGVVKAGTKRLGGVTVSLRIGPFKEKTTTTENGDYSFQIPQDKIITKVKLLFGHSNYAEQEREFDVSQNQIVKEIEPVILSIGSYRYYANQINFATRAYVKVENGIVMSDQGSNDPRSGGPANFSWDVSVPESGEYVVSINVANPYSENLVAYVLKDVDVDIAITDFNPFSMLTVKPSGKNNYKLLHFPEKIHLEANKPTNIRFHAGYQETKHLPYFKHMELVLIEDK